MSNRAKRALTEEQEQNMYNKLRDDYFNTKKDANASFFMPIRDCQNLINMS